MQPRADSGLVHVDLPVDEFLPFLTFLETAPRLTVQSVDIPDRPKDIEKGAKVAFAVMVHSPDGQPGPRPSSRRRLSSGSSALPSPQSGSYLQVPSSRLSRGPFGTPPVSPLEASLRALKVRVPWHVRCVGGCGAVGVEGPAPWPCGWGLCGEHRPLTRSRLSWGPQPLLDSVRLGHRPDAVPLSNPASTPLCGGVERCGGLQGVLGRLDCGAAVLGGCWPAAYVWLQTLTSRQMSHQSNEMH